MDQQTTNKDVPILFIWEHLNDSISKSATMWYRFIFSSRITQVEVQINSKKAKPQQLRSLRHSSV